MGVKGRLGSGSSESPYFKSAETKVSLLLRQTQEIFEAGTFSDVSNFLNAATHFFFRCVISHSWRTRWRPSAAASLSVGKNHKKIQYTVFSAEPEREAFRKFHFSAAYKSVPTRLLALIFLVSTLFSAVIFLMFS